MQTQLTQGLTAELFEKAVQALKEAQVPVMEDFAAYMAFHERLASFRTSKVHQPFFKSRVRAKQKAARIARRNNRG